MKLTKLLFVASCVAATASAQPAQANTLWEGWSGEHPDGNWYVVQNAAHECTLAFISAEQSSAKFTTSVFRNSSGLFAYSLTLETLNDLFPEQVTSSRTEPKWFTAKVNITKTDGRLTHAMPQTSKKLHNNAVYLTTMLVNKNALGMLRNTARIDLAGASVIFGSSSGDMAVTKLEECSGKLVPNVLAAPD